MSCRHGGVQFPCMPQKFSFGISFCWQVGLPSITDRPLCHVTRTDALHVPHNKCYGTRRGLALNPCLNGTAMTLGTEGFKSSVTFGMAIAFLFALSVATPRLRLWVECVHGLSVACVHVRQTTMGEGEANRGGTAKEIETFDEREREEGRLEEEEGAGDTPIYILFSAIRRQGAVQAIREVVCRVLGGKWGMGEGGRCLQLILAHMKEGPGNLRAFLCLALLTYSDVRGGAPCVTRFSPLPLELHPACCSCCCTLLNLWQWLLCTACGVAVNVMFGLASGSDGYVARFASGPYCWVPLS